MSTLYIVRGLPGSGKSTLARKLVRESRHREADMYFVVDGEYCWDSTRVKEAYRWCQSQTRRLLQTCGDCAVSNTFTRRWEYQPYIEMAQEHAFDVQVLRCCGNWESEHGVPQEVVDAMRARWEPHLSDA